MTTSSFQNMLYDSTEELVWAHFSFDKTSYRQKIHPTVCLLCVFRWCGVSSVMQQDPNPPSASISLGTSSKALCSFHVNDQQGLEQTNQSVNMTGGTDRLRTGQLRERHKELCFYCQLLSAHGIQLRHFKPITCDARW